MSSEELPREIREGGWQFRFYSDVVKEFCDEAEQTHSCGALHNVILCYVDIIMYLQV